jgi:hypothetical protein
MSDISHMHAYLMGAPGLQTALQIGAAPQALRDVPTRHGGAPVGANRHFLTVFRGASDGRVNGSGVLTRRPDD